MKTKHTHRHDPVALALASSVCEQPVKGFYNKKTDTWSDREFTTASRKKHCEAR
jgi:hypothetical protein